MPVKTAAELELVLRYINKEYLTPGRKGFGRANKVLAVVKFFLPYYENKLTFARRAINGWNCRRSRQEKIRSQRDGGRAGLSSYVERSESNGTCINVVVWRLLTYTGPFGTQRSRVCFGTRAGRFWVLSGPKEAAIKRSVLVPSVWTLCYTA